MEIPDLEASDAGREHRRERGLDPFVARLHSLSIANPHSWRRAESVGSDIGYCKGRMV